MPHNKFEKGKTTKENIIKSKLVTYMNPSIAMMSLES